ncbi:MAG: V-type ATP synthase subunit F [Oscillospiraceae bacterium]|jgi:V/A-type H+-transporting ATPase subunit F|nr:V-type ATP synthase subunit F [Oscillospiraceae bacterium]
MKMFLISDTNDTAIGMRMAGIEGVVVHDRAAALEALETAAANTDYAVIFVTGALLRLCRAEITERKLASVIPLIVGIPDRSGDSHISDNIGRYIKEAIGVQL